MKITKREIIASITIVGVMLILGFIISGNIREKNLERNEEYNQALKINNDKDMLEYGIKTNIGNAFVYGDIIAVNPVNYKSKEYSSLTRVREKYTMHTRVVHYTDSKGHSHSRTETYWTWDEIDRENKHSDKINIIGVVLPWEVLNNGNKGFFSESHIETTDAGFHLRDVWYGSEAKHTGTLYGNLGEIKNKKEANFKSFYENVGIGEIVEELEKEYNIVFFWVCWGILSIVIVGWFWYKENEWLE